MAEQYESDVSFGDFLGIIKRRVGLLFGVFAAVLLVGVAVAFRVAPIYESTGVLLAEQPAVPDYVVRSTVPTYPEERVRIVTQRVLTDDNLGRIIEENGLYPDLAGTPRVARSEFRRNLSMSAEDPALLENIMGRSASATSVAFSISFSDPSPRMARDVADDLIALYLNENQRARREQAATTTEFLTQEARRLEKEIAEREKGLAEFKSKFGDALPTLANVNLQMLDRTERDLEAVEQEIRSLREQQSLYTSELANLSPLSTMMNDQGAPILSPPERLKMLQRSYPQLTAVYSADHPDVLKMRREMEALSEATGLPAFDRATLQSELAATQDQLAAAKDRYSADHPDVQRLQRTVDSLREALASTPTRPAAASQFTPDNPLYIQKQVQLGAVNVELDAALARRDDLRKRLAGLENRLTVAPEVEREFSALNRGYEQLMGQYSEVESKLREAEVALNLESELRGERFTVLEPPGLPRSPSQPNRLAVLLLTFVIGTALAAAVVAIAERMDNTVRHPRDIANLLEIPPLVAIPYVINDDDLRRRTRHRLIATTAVVAWAGVILFLVLTPAA